MAKILQLLKNSNVGIDKTTAKNALIEKLKNSLDGEPVLARYTDEDGNVKTLFGISGGNGENKHTIFDINAVPADVQKMFDDLIDGNTNTDYNTIKKIAESLATINGTSDGSIKKALTDAKSYTDTEIQKLDKADTVVDGKFVDSVSEEDGIITVSRKAVAADKVTAKTITGSTDTVAVDGANVAAQIASLGKTLKTVQDNAAKYEVVKLTADEVTALGDENVKEAYKVVSYTGDFATATDIKQVGDAIKIGKDQTLKGVSYANQILTFTYILANGSESPVNIDMSELITEAEFGAGIKVVNHKAQIKLSDDNEGAFLTVGETGLKLSGVQTAIDTAVANKNVSAEGDDYVSATATDDKVTVATNVGDLTVGKEGTNVSTLSGEANKLVKADDAAAKVSNFVNNRISEEIGKLDATVGEATVSAGKHVAVQVVETDGKITAVNVNENDIASAKGLTDEITRATAAEDKIESSVGLAADGSHRTTTGNYTKDATTIAGEIAALDAALKTVSDTAISVKAGNGITISGSGTEKTIMTKIKDADPILEVTTNGIAVKEDAIWNCGEY